MSRGDIAGRFAVRRTGEGQAGVYFGGLDIDAFASYLSASSPYTPGPLDRITR